MNPFEIRLELLKLATSILSERASAERMKQEYEYNLSTEVKKADIVIPDFATYTLDDVVEYAEIMNDFVSSGNK